MNNIFMTKYNPCFNLPKQVIVMRTAFFLQIKQIKIKNFPFFNIKNSITIMNTQFNGKGWRSTNRQLDGLSQPLTRKLEDMDPKELSELYEKTNIMLNNP